MQNNPLTDAPIHQIPGLSAGVYQLDGQPIEVRDLCARALVLDQALLKHWTLPNGQPVYGVASHEAAEVLRQHGHSVGELPAHAH